jgi:dihydrofolate synthase / folylpolyglutamate synthase
LRFNKLDEWLNWQQQLHPHTIELGLERVGEVASRMGLSQPQHCIITVAGTNGKGSCVAMLESILTEAGYRVGSYTSPHLLRYNERVRLARETVSDEALCRAFECIDAARDSITLSYFEFGTLAAMHIFAQSHLDVAILEVGLGGRLDAVNMQDPNCALITSIDLDHTEWLGTDREAIGLEKAGIIRAQTPVVCGDPDPPASIGRRSAAVGAELYQLGRDFGYTREGETWDWYAARLCYRKLPLPGLRGEVQLQNASTALMGLSLLNNRLPVVEECIRGGLQKVALAGRFQRLPGPVEIVVDVAHNPAGVKALASMLRATPTTGRTFGVFAVLADKDATRMVEAIEDLIDYWCLAANHSDRALPANQLQALLARRIDKRITCFKSVVQAYQAACRMTRGADRIVVFGSAFTVAEVLALHV